MRLRGNEDNRRLGISEGAHPVLWVQESGTTSGIALDARHEPASGLSRLAVDAGPVQLTDASSMGELRGPWYRRLPRVGGLRNILARYGAKLSNRFNDRAQRRKRELLQSQLRLGYVEGASEQSAQFENRWYRRAVRDIRHTAEHYRLPDSARGDGPFRIDRSAESFEPVYDILDCGPRNRFVVRGADGPFIVHNCENICQAGCRDFQADAILDLEAAAYPVVMHTHDDVAAEVDEGFGSESEFGEIMARPRAWAPGMPLAVKTWSGTRYGD